MYVGKIIIKGIVSIISRSPLFKNGIELFITRPLKPLSDNVEDNYVIIGLKILNSDNAYFFSAVYIDLLVCINGIIYCYSIVASQ